MQVVQRHEMPCTWNSLHLYTLNFHACGYECLKGLANSWFFYWCDGSIEAVWYFLTGKRILLLHFLFILFQLWCFLPFHLFKLLTCMVCSAYIMKQYFVINIWYIICFNRFWGTVQLVQFKGRFGKSKE